MTLQQAIEEVKREWRGVDYTAECFTDDVWLEHHCTAIATFLNAVVKGELKHVGD